MYPISESGFTSDLYGNIPNMSLAFTMYTTTFGNGSFVVQPPQPGELSDQFPTLPYLSLEALLYTQQASNPVVSPYNISGGATAGQSVIAGSQTANDVSGVPRSLTGTQVTNS
jgi:hypothetical protein